MPEDGPSPPADFWDDDDDVPLSAAAGTSAGTERERRRTSPSSSSSSAAFWRGGGGRGGFAGGSGRGSGRGSARGSARGSGRGRGRGGAYVRQKTTPNRLSSEGAPQEEDEDGGEGGEEQEEQDEEGLDGCTGVPAGCRPGESAIRASLKSFLTGGKAMIGGGALEEEEQNKSAEAQRDDDADALYGDGVGALHLPFANAISNGGPGPSAVRRLLRSADRGKSHGLRFSFLDLADHDSAVAHLLLFQPRRILGIFDRVLTEAQWNVLTAARDDEKHSRLLSRVQGAGGWSVKPGARARVHTLPYYGGYFFHDRIPGQAHLNKLVEFQGTVIRVGNAKSVVETAKFECASCQHPFTVFADFEQMNSFPRITRCPNPQECPAKMNFRHVEDVGYVDYQEVKLQEHVAKMGSGRMPKTTIAVLRHALVDVAKAGDDCRITAIPTRRWRVLPGRDEQLYDIELVLDAVDLVVVNKHKWRVDLSEEMGKEFRAFWETHGATERVLTARNKIVASVCPQLFGMAAVKLALLLSVIGGVPKKEADGNTRTRGECHMLMVGEPGCGKSQCLKYGAALGARSVLTTGGGSTSAGLTVAAVRETGGDWALEAGALVLANDGVCCIDEFSSIRKADRVAIHEAMEQQTIHVNKAGIHCTLPTKTTVIAATNPKGEYDLQQSLSVNTNLESPLLSRFDLVMVLADLTRNTDAASRAASSDPYAAHKPDGDVGWDARVSHQVISAHVTDPLDNSKEFWDLEKLRNYVNYAKARKPGLTDEAEEVIQTYYHHQRRIDPVHQARTTTRLLESLLRLAEAHARLMCHDEVNELDAVTAVLLCEVSMSSVSLLREHGDGDLTPETSPMFGSDALHSSFPADPEEEFIILRETLYRRLRLEHLLQRYDDGSGSASPYPPAPVPATRRPAPERSPQAPAKLTGMTPLVSAAYAPVSQADRSSSIGLDESSLGFWGNESVLDQDFAERDLGPATHGGVPIRAFDVSGLEDVSAMLGEEPSPVKMDNQTSEDLARTESHPGAEWSRAFQSGSVRDAFDAPEPAHQEMLSAAGDLPMSLSELSHSPAARESFGAPGFDTVNAKQAAAAATPIGFGGASEALFPGGSVAVRHEQPAVRSAGRRRRVFMD